MTARDGFDPFSGGDLERSVPATEPQREIWLAVELGGQSANLAYNESTSLRIHGKVDRALLEAAFRDVTARHEALRSTLSDDGTVLCVESSLRTRLEVHDWCALDASTRRQRYAEFHNAAVSTPFDLARGPLFRAALLVLEPEHCELVLIAHHVICDGWSFGVLCEEITAAYKARQAANAVDLPAPPRFTDYAAHRIAAGHGEAAATTERFWLDKLGRQPPTLDLPTDNARPRQRTFHAARVDRTWPAPLADGLRQVGRKTGASFVTTLLALTDAHLARTSGQLDFVVGMAAAGQTDEGWGGLVGHCVNTLPLRMQIDPEAPFADHVRFVKGAILDAFEHQHASFGSLLQKLDLPRDPSRVPLVPVLFNLDPKLAPLRLGEASAEIFGNPRICDAFEVFLNFCELATGVRIELTYNRDLFAAATMESWLDRLTELAQAAIANPAIPLGQMAWVPATERDLLLGRFAGRLAAQPEWPTVTAMIERQARSTPEAIAVRDAQTALSYRELDQRANALAAKLVALGLGPESLVGICVERSARMVVALLAIWKAGAAYVPLDPSYPASRLALIAEDARLTLLLAERALAHVLSGLSLSPVWIDDESGCLPEAPRRTDQPRSLAYVLHTSGSTGKPKGVMIEHGSLVNFLASMQKHPGFGPRDVLVAVTTLSFDIAGLELYLPLVSGGQTVVAAHETAQDGKRLAQLLSSSGATVFQATPGTFRLLLEAGFQGGPGFTALCGGEAFPRDLATELRRRCARVFNMYGPTETTVWSLCAPVTTDEGAITLGRPIANTTTYVLDARHQPVPIGVPGELFIGGVGVARGYLHRPDLTRERFLPDPFAQDEQARYYKTGDIVRYDRDGNLYFQGRADNQVKLRGFRIELDDIACALASCPGVSEACAAIREVGTGDLRLVAYVCPAAGGVAPDPSQLRTHVQALLPPYMLPQHFVALDHLPRTPNGKLDRKALPAPTDVGVATDSYVAPVTKTQARLVELWQDLLRVHRVGIRDGFFELGGHSMLAARMLSRIREHMGIELPMRTVFEAQTIEALSAHVEAALLRAPKPDDSRPHVDEEL